MILAFRLAKENLRRHKVRSLLSTVGIIVSVFIISLIFIISDSLKSNISHQAAKLTKNMAIVNGSVSHNDLFNLPSTTPSDTLNNLDSRNISSLVNDSTINSNLVINGPITYDNRALPNINTIATTINDPKILNVQIKSGNWIDNDDSGKKWVVLGYDLANRLMGNDHVQNQVVSIKGQKYTVVGVLEKINQPLSIFGYNIDQTAFISLHNGQSSAKTDKLSQLIIQANGEVDHKQIAKALSIQHDDSSDYSINSSNNLAAKLASIVNYVSIGTSIFAGITLLISGISIMNTMLVNVIERQREIGIRKAVGATTRDIMNQFLVESLIMSVRGGAIGIILAYVVALAILIFVSIPISFSWMAVLVGFIIPVIIGIFFGVYPARRAAKQDIITALNQLT